MSFNLSSVVRARHSAVNHLPPKPVTHRPQARAILVPSSLPAVTNLCEQLARARNRPFAHLNYPPSAVRSTETYSRCPILFLFGFARTRGSLRLGRALQPVQLSP